MFFWRCSRIAGNFLPETPTIDRSPTLPRRRRSNIVSPTTPTFLSEVLAAPDTKPVVYSPVPTIKTAGGAMMLVGMWLMVAISSILPK